jgi:hypothetical protein
MSRELSMARGRGELFEQDVVFEAVGALVEKGRSLDDPEPGSTAASEATDRRNDTIGRPTADGGGLECGLVSEAFEELDVQVVGESPSLDGIVGLEDTLACRLPRRHHRSQLLTGGERVGPLASARPSIDEPFELATRQRPKTTTETSIADVVDTDGIHDVEAVGVSMVTSSMQRRGDGATRAWTFTVSYAPSCV